MTDSFDDDSFDDDDYNGSFQPRIHQPTSFGRARASHDDGGSVRVQFGGNHGSIWDVAQATNFGEVHNGGLYSGDLPTNAGPGEETHIRGQLGGTDLGGFSARTADGAYPVLNAADLQPNDIVTLPNGMETLYHLAQAYGLLPSGARQAAAPSQDGDTDQGPNNDDDTGRQEQEQDPLDYKEPMSQEAESAMVEALDKGGDTVFAALANLQQTGEISRTVIEEYASKLQVEPAVIEQKAEVILRGYTTDACRGASRIADTDETLAYEALHDATKSRRSEFNEAMERHLETGKTGHYAPLVTEYIAKLADTAPARVLSAEVGPGITVERDIHGDILVTTEGQSCRYEDAVNARLVTVRTGRNGLLSINARNKR